MGFFNFFKDIFSNPNKEQSSEYYSDSLSANSGSSFYATEKNIIKIPEFMSAIDMIANDISSAKFYETNVKYTDKNTIKYNEIKINSKWNKLLNVKPNSFQSSVEFWKTNINNLFIRGAFYFYIYRDSKNRPKELIPIHPNSIRKVKDKNDNYAYQITYFEGNYIGEKSKKMLVPYGDIFSNYIFDLENISDLNFRTVYSSMLEQLGLKNQYDLVQLNQSARILAHVEVPDKIDDDQRNKLKNSMKTFFENAKDIQKSAVLVTGTEAKVNILNNDKTQIKSAIEPEFVKNIMVKFANALHIPLPKLNIVDTGQSFYKSREGINIDYMSDAIRPILNKIVSKMTSLLASNNNSEFIFDIKKLMEVDYATRGEYTAKMRQNAIATTNELRTLNGWIPVKGGDKIYGNGTLIELGSNQQDIQENNNDNEQEKGGT